MQKSIHEFKLVNSTYDLQEAREVLISLVNDKINSINGTIFSRCERFGDDCEHLRNRVEQLKEVKLKLMEHLVDLEGTDCKIKITAPVILEIETPAGVEVKELESVL